MPSSIGDIKAALIITAGGGAKRLRNLEKMFSAVPSIVEMIPFGTFVSEVSLPTSSPMFGNIFIIGCELTGSSSPDPVASSEERNDAKFRDTHYNV